MSVTKWVKGTVVSAAVVALLVAIGLLVGSSTHHTEASTSPSSTVLSTTTSVVQTKTAAQCGGYNVELDVNQGNKVASNAPQTLDVNQPAKAVQTLMVYAKHDPRTLSLYWNSSPLGKRVPVKDWRKLVVKGCYTSVAQNKFQQLVGAYESAKVTTSVAPAIGMNTGVYAGGGSPFQEASGSIGGNRAAVQIVFLDGSKIWIMRRCGNVVTTAPIPSVPIKPTTPTTTPTTAPPATTPTTTPTTAPPTTVCASGKCHPPVTYPAPPTTASPPSGPATTLPANNSGPGAPNTIPPGEVPTTVAPPASPPPSIAPPTSRVSY